MGTTKQELLHIGDFVNKQKIISIIPLPDDSKPEETEPWDKKVLDLLLNNPDIGYISGENLSDTGYQERANPRVIYITTSKNS